MRKQGDEAQLPFIFGQSNSGFVKSSKDNISSLCEARVAHDMASKRKQEKAVINKIVKASRKFSW